MTLIDTHAHLTNKDFRGDLRPVIDRARQAGVEFIINIGYDLRSSAAAVDLAEKHDCCYAAVGVHPHDAKTLDQEVFKGLEALVRNPKVVAVGEMGLDFFRNLSPRDVQVEAFKKQLAWAGTLNLPVVVHDRDAHAEIMDILKEHPGLKVVLHCFAGDAEVAKEAKRRGYLLSIGGPVTFKNSKHLPEVLKITGLEGLMLETDCPYLAPEPHRGARNEPAYLPLIAQKVSELLDPLTFDDVCRVTTVNAKKFFNIGRIDPAKIAYQIRDSLYLNITNRCTNACVFCIRQKTDFIKGHNLRLEREPDFQEVVDAVGDPLKYREIVFCGYGESTYRLPDLPELCRGLRRQHPNARLRLNTVGLGSLIWGRDIAPELAGLLDAVAVSLNTADPEQWLAIHAPLKALRARGYESVLGFIRSCAAAGLKTSVTAVKLPGTDLAAVRRLSAFLGASFRARLAL